MRQNLGLHVPQDSLSKVTKGLRKILDSRRFNHCLRVQKTAVALAKHYNVDERKASTAGLLHDCAKAMSRDELVTKAKAIGKKINCVEMFEPKLLHAIVSAYLAEHEFGIKDKETLSAIAKHTLGGICLSRLEEIIYIADHIEEDRDYDGVSEIRQLAFSDIDSAIIRIAISMIKHLLDNGLPVEETVVKMMNYYMFKDKKNG